MDRIEEKIISIIDQHADELQALAMDIFVNAEQGYYEHRTAKIVSDFLKKLGLETTEGLAVTGLRAPIKGKNEGPNIALIGELDGKQVLHQTVFTDDSGFSPLMTLPAVSAKLSLTPDNAVPYVTYTIRVVKDGFYPTENTKVPIFEGITSRQPVYLIPLPESMQQGDWQVFPDNGPSDL